MKHPSPIDKHDRFSGSLRHYHRAGGQKQRTWDEWIDGTPTDSKKSISRVKIALVVLAILGLGGIIVGLIVELG